MNVVLNAISRAIAAYGSPVGIIRSGATYTVQGMVLPMDSNTINTYFDANESVGLIKPAVTLYVAGTETNPPLANDTFDTTDFDPIRGTFGGAVVITVRKVTAIRIANVVVLYVAVCD